MRVFHALFFVTEIDERSMADEASAAFRSALAKVLIPDTTKIHKRQSKRGEYSNESVSVAELVQHINKFPTYGPYDYAGSLPLSAYNGSFHHLPIRSSSVWRRYPYVENKLSRKKLPMFLQLQEQHPDKLK